MSCNVLCSCIQTIQSSLRLIASVLCVIYPMKATVIVSIPLLQFCSICAFKCLQLTVQIKRLLFQSILIIYLLLLQQKQRGWQTFQCSMSYLYHEKNFQTSLLTLLHYYFAQRLISSMKGREMVANWPQYRFALIDNPRNGLDQLLRSDNLVILGIQEYFLAWTAHFCAHGLRVSSNETEDEERQATFFPLTGAYQAILLLVDG